MGIIRYGLHTFFSLIICLIATLRGTGKEMGLHLCICFSHSHFGVAQTEAKKDKKKKEVVVDGPQSGVIVMVIWGASL